MEETRSGIGWWGIVIVIFLLFIVCGGGFGNGFFGGRGFGAFNGFPGSVGEGFGFQNYKATCDAEKAEIINTASTQYKVVDQGNLTREAIAAEAQTTRALINQQAMQDLRDKYAEALRQNTMLTAQLYSDSKFGALEKQIAEIQCNMLTRPKISGVGVSCPSAGILNGLGINTLNGGCGAYNGYVA